MLMFNKITSSTCNLEVGAPRRSIFRPLLFNLEFTELPMDSEERNFQLFAYITTIVHQDKSESEINETLEHIPAWLF